MNTLNTKALLGLLFLAVAMGLLLFIPAGTVKYWQAWAYLAVFFGASLLVTIYLMKKDPAAHQCTEIRGAHRAAQPPTRKASY